MLRKVAWTNLWNRAAANHGDYGTLIHLTNDSGMSGKTLCGREYPADKGCPASGRLCKRCKKKAGQFDFSALAWVASRKS